jgi:hypothetical protein
VQIPEKNQVLFRQNGKSGLILSDIIKACERQESDEIIKYKGK